MDNAWLGSIDIAQAKAYTARAFDMPTKDLAPLATVVTLDEAADGYKDFDKGAAKQFVLNPNDLIAA